MTETVSLRIDPDSLTIGDLEDFELVTGLPIDKALRPVPVRDEDGNKVLDEKGRPETEANVSATVLKALVWISRRAEVPGFTLEDARNVKVSALELVTPDAADSEGKSDGPS